MREITISPKSLTIYSGIVTVILMLFFLHGFQTISQDEITVKRINVINEDGTHSVIIANPDRIPPPILDGKEYKRAVEAGGIVLYNNEGNERGGIAVSDDDKRAMNAMVLDYNTADAIGMSSMEDNMSKDYAAMISVNDPNKDRKVGHAIQRLTLGTNNGNAGLTINTPAGKPRLIIQVDSLNQISFYALDDDGMTVKNWMDE